MCETNNHSKVSWSYLLEKKNECLLSVVSLKFWLPIRSVTPQWIFMSSVYEEARWQLWNEGDHVASLSLSSTLPLNCPITWCFFKKNFFLIFFPRPLRAVAKETVQNREWKWNIGLWRHFSSHMTQGMYQWSWIWKPGGNRE